jgi:hypothetical protein
MIKLFCENYKEKTELSLHTPVVFGFKIQENKREKVIFQFDRFLMFAIRKTVGTALLRHLRAPTRRHMNSNTGIMVQQFPSLL